MRKLILLFLLNTYYFSIYASENPLTNLVNDTAGKAINEANNLGGDDLKLTITIILIIISLFIGLFMLFKKK